MAISFELMPLTLERVLVVVKNWADHFFTTICSKRQLEYSSICFYLSVSKYIGDNFFWLAGLVNKIDKYVYFLSNPGSDSRGYLVSNPGDLMYYGVMLLLNIASWT
jgi:hypothetical protein